MKKNRIVVVCVLLLVALAVFFFYRHTAIMRHSESTPREPRPTLPKEADANRAADPARIAPGTPPEGPATPAMSSQAAQAARQAQLVKILREANQPVVFYGRVLDQDDQPLPGVKVTLKLSAIRERMVGSLLDTDEHYTRVTDAQGLFTFDGLDGTQLFVESLEKRGYMFSPRSQRYYWYKTGEPNRHLPSSESPEVFRLWKILGAERLVHRRARTAIPYDGTPVIYDLAEGRETFSGGDMRVRLVRTPRDIVYGQGGYSWTATIEAVEGGLIISTNEFMYLAPETGYQSQIEVTMPAGAPGWSDTKSLSFYLRSRGGRSYGRVTVKFMTGSDRPKTGFNYDSYLNTNGSRVLEYDPMQDVR